MGAPFRFFVNISEKSQGGNFMSIKKSILIIAILGILCIFGTSFCFAEEADSYIVIQDKIKTGEKLSSMDDVEVVDTYKTEEKDVISEVVADENTIDEIEKMDSVLCVQKDVAIPLCASVKRNGIIATQNHLIFTGIKQAKTKIDLSKNRPKIAILDTGCDKIEGLENKVIRRVDCGSEEDLNEQGTIDLDKMKHGTAIASIIGSDKNTALGTEGICNPELMIYQCNMDDDSILLSKAVKGMVDAIDNGAKVVNMSFASYDNFESTYGYMIKYAKDHDVLCVCSAGNEDGNYIEYPAYYAKTYDNVISVSGTCVDETFRSISEYFGYAGYTRNNGVSLVAPGMEVPANVGNGKVSKFSGTSFAAPIVVGAAGLLLQKNPNLKAKDLKKILTSTCHDISSIGYDIYTGNGLIDVEQARKKVSGEKFTNFSLIKYKTKPLKTKYKNGKVIISWNEKPGYTYVLTGSSTDKDNKNCVLFEKAFTSPKGSFKTKIYTQYDSYCIEAYKMFYGKKVYLGYFDSWYMGDDKLPAKISKIKYNKKSGKLSWKKQKKANTYEVMIYKNNKTKTIKKTKKASLNIGKKFKGKVYIRAWNSYGHFADYLNDGGWKTITM